jgi:hypothetical protein
MKSLLSALVGTSVLTAFSYLVSGRGKKNFREPELLGLFLKRLRPGVSRGTAEISGWLLHYTLGCGWGKFYHHLEKGAGKPESNFPLFFGCGSGLVAIGSWHAVFVRHPSPPDIDLKAFYLQLFFGHVLFSLAVSVTDRLARA